MRLWILKQGEDIKRDIRHAALGVSTSWSSAHGRLQITPAGDGVFVFWGGSTGELSDTLYCDTEIDGYTNRQSAVVHFDPDPEPLPHVALSSPNTIFVNDDDDNHNGTGEMHSVKEFLQEAFSYVGLDWEKYTHHDSRYDRPSEVDQLLGDPSKAKRVLGWEPKVTFKGLVKMMMDADLALAEKELKLKS